jgi:hypothetical protein
VALVTCLRQARIKACESVGHARLITTKILFNVKRHGCRAHKSLVNACVFHGIHNSLKWRRRHTHPDDRGFPLHEIGAYLARYTDHFSILKFIEHNWGLAPLTSRSRDNFPEPKYAKGHPYVPVNGPAIGDLFDLFDFGGK